MNKERDMDSFVEQNKELWSEKVVEGNLKWPDEHVIRFVKHHFQDAANTRILDFGCGTGRDAAALLQEGYRVIAMDCNKAGLDVLQERAKLADTTGGLVCVVNQELEVPIEEESVQAIIADGSLYLYSFEKRKQLLSHLKNCLCKKGLFWANWRSTEDSLCGNGTLLEENFYRLGAESVGREGFYYYFADQKGLTALYQDVGFKILSIDKCEFTRNNGAEVCSWWHVIAEKND